ncbi:MAG TPA: restriction endonuclease [Microthrixaceae bacterium]|nr:restriction endonuclease [Microthrixaceae bacterium]
MSGTPTWEQFNVPVLTVLSDGMTRSLRQLRRDVADAVGLTAEQRAETLPSGQLRADNRIGWAASFLNRVDALDHPSRGQYVITDFGRELLERHPTGITENDLKAVAKEGDEWWLSRSAANGQEDQPLDTSATDLDPTEQVEQGVARIHEEVASELLSRLVDQDPAFFEGAVVELLLAMGYGGVGGRGVTTDLTNDGGIDGVIDQDVLGLSKVYVQAKRYAPTNAVQRPEVQGFVGALSGKADGGVFITTSRFSPGAIEWVRTVPARIILIDGRRLAELMIEYGVGVQVGRTYRVVEVDEDFFT